MSLDAEKAPFCKVVSYIKNDTNPKQKEYKKGTVSFASCIEPSFLSEFPFNII